MIKTLNDYHNFLKDKHVIIVGPAGYLQGKKQGGAIDSYDIVVRANHALPIKYPEDYGSRTDVLYHAMTKTVLNKEPEGITHWKDVNWFVSVLDNEYLKNFSPHLQNVTIIDKKFYDGVKDKIGSKLPGTGILAIKHLLDSPAKSVTIKGFDFYKSDTYSGYPESCPPDKWHDQNAQKIYLKRLSKTSRLVMDTETANVIGAKKEKINFQTLDEADKVVLDNFHKIPKDVDYVIGIPRSGLLFANLIALYLNKPVLTLNEFINNYAPTTGRYRAGKNGNHKKYLLVEDCVGTGKTFIDLKDSLKRNDIIYLAVYGSSDKKRNRGADVILNDEVKKPRAWQWNVFHHPARRILWDMDGVICSDPKKGLDHPQPAYKHFVKTATPLILPNLPIYGIVTGRLECYRKDTEEWLKKHGVIYSRLVMKPTKDKRGGDSIANFKGKIYRNSMASLFIESTKRQSPIISKIANKPVFCVDDRKLYK